MQPDPAFYGILDPWPGGDVPATIPRLADMLIDRWCAAYRTTTAKAEICEVRLGPYSYLFDLANERAIVAFGSVAGRAHGARDAARMAGHPKSEGADYHRGHMIAHTAGGGTDINLFSQRGAINIGPFRRLERLSLQFPGSFYFVRLLYPAGPSQKPDFVEQGLVVNDPARRRFEYAFFQN